MTDHDAVTKLDAVLAFSYRACDFAAMLGLALAALGFCFVLTGLLRNRPLRPGPSVALSGGMVLFVGALIARAVLAA